MLKKWFVVCMTAGLVVLELPTDAAQTDRARDGLTGLVQKVTTESGTWKKGDSISVITTIYDLAGNVTELQVGSYKAGNDVPKKWGLTLYEHDPSGKIGASTSFDADGLLLGKTLYAYDKRGNEIEQAVYDKDGDLKFKFAHFYSPADLKVETRSYLHDGSLLSQSRYAYDQQGNMISLSSSKDCIANQGCKTIEYSAFNTYDSKGRITESVIKKGDGTFDERRLYKYDPAGNLIEQATSNSDGSLREKESYSYKFDAVGNWIEKVTSKFNANSRLEQVSTDRRKITYYAGREKS